MYYLELIQRFWEFNQRRSIGSTAISMYLYLLKTGYENNRYDFRISDSIISKDLRLTRKTVKSVKEKLQNLGLIRFQITIGFPCYYRLVLDYSLQISKAQKIEKVKSVRTTASEKSEILEISFQNVVSIPDTDDICSEVVSQNKKSHNLQSSKSIFNDKNIPSMAEFIEYAQTLEFYDSQLDSGIRKKYEAWVNNGWKNNSDRPITNWKSSLKSTLPYMKNKTDSNQLFMQTIPNIRRPKSLNEK